MSVPKKVLMRKIKKRGKTKLTVLKQREEQKDQIRKIIETSQQNTEDIPSKSFEVTNDASFSVLSEKVCKNTLKAIKDMGFTNMTETQMKELFRPFWKEEIWYRLHNYVSHERIIYAYFLEVFKELMKYHYRSPDEWRQ